MTQILNNKSFLLSLVVAFAFLGTGIAFLFLGLVDYSWILFMFLPTVLGVSIATLPEQKFAVWGGVVAVLVTLSTLYFFGLTGFICVVMSLPVIILLMYVGFAVTRFVIKRNAINASGKFSILILPLIPFLVAAPTEHYLKTDKEVAITVTTEQVFDYSPEQVYDAIKSVDTLDAEKTFLMHFDLPIPTKCILEKEEIGGLRTCYFDPGNLSNAEFGGGTITERITELERGKILKMDVIDYTLVGRNWLGFKEAIYYFEKTRDNKCKMRRVTTYTSELTPRFYWEPLEKFGIQQEHEFVFRNLAKDLEKKHGR